MGIISKDKAKSEAKGDFAIRLGSLVEAAASTGYLATVKRAFDGEERSELQLPIWTFIYLIYCYCH